MTLKYVLLRIPTSLLIISGLLLLITKCSFFDNNKPEPPEVVYKLGNREGSLIRLPDSCFLLFKVIGNNLFSMTSTDGRTWSEPKVEIENDPNQKNLYYNGSGIVLVDKGGELHSIYQKFRGVSQYANAPKPKYPFQYSDTLYDIWH